MELFSANTSLPLCICYCSSAGGRGLMRNRMTTRRARVSANGASLAIQPRVCLWLCVWAPNFILCRAGESYLQPETVSRIQRTHTAWCSVASLTAPKCCHYGLFVKDEEAWFCAWCGRCARHTAGVHALLPPTTAQPNPGAGRGTVGPSSHSSG